MNIEQTVSAAVAGLQLGNTFTFDDLLRSVQDRRHRRLRIIELADLDTWTVPGLVDTGEVCGSR